MKILLTGQPGIGKSTVIDECARAFPGLAVWMLTREVLDTAGRRIGFTSSTSSGHRQLVSHKFAISSDTIVGSNRVDVAALQEILNNLFDAIAATQPTFVMIDEVGSIQLSDPEFSNKFEALFKSTTNLLATLHAGEPQLEEYRNSPHAIHITVSQENRGRLPNLLHTLMVHHRRYNQLTTHQQPVVNNLLENYIEKNNSLQLEKLLNNAISYVAQGRVVRTSPTHWSVAGNHGSHEVAKGETFTCDCDLFLGNNEYAATPGECSHIQAVKIVNEGYEQ